MKRERSYLTDACIVSRGPDQRGPEPLWRFNARNDADRQKELLFKSGINRRAFIAGGAVLLNEYLEQRRAVASPLFKPGGSSSGGAGSIYILANPSTTYSGLENAFFAMVNGDTLMLPAGLTYQYSGQTYYYANYASTKWVHSSGVGYGSNYLGSSYGGTMAADHGFVQAYGAANNGRAQITPPYGILAADYHANFSSGDPTMVFNSSTPVSNFWPCLTYPTTVSLNVSPGVNNGAFTYDDMSYTGIDVPSNSLTGVTSNFSGTVRAGTIVFAGMWNGQGIFVPVGQNPGWSFTNLELAYAPQGIRQIDSNPGGPYISSCSLTNCFIHDCPQSNFLGYAGIGSANNISVQIFNSEIVYCGYDGQTHNMYVGHISELIFDNSYTHLTCGAWVFKTRAALNLVTYSQLRGERTSAFTGIDQASDLSQGGLTYFIGTIHQMSLNPGNAATFNYRAEYGPIATWQQYTGSTEAGSLNPLQEFYHVNCNFIGSTSGALIGPLQVYAIGPAPPPFPLLGQSAGGALPARQYWATVTGAGTSGGETISTPLAGGVANATVYENLNVSAGNVFVVNSPVQPTGVSAWNCYANYGDPLMYMSNPTAPGNYGAGNSFFWDSGLTQQVFNTTSGGSTISVTGTFVSGNNVITSVSGLVGLASLFQLIGMTVYIGGVNTQLIVNTVDPVAATITMSGSYTGSGAITFGYLLLCGFTYQTTLGESINAALDYTSWMQGGGYFSFNNYTDGSYTSTGANLVVRPFMKVDPGQKLVVNAPPSGPTWATGVNFYATPIPYNSSGPLNNPDAMIFGLTKQGSIAFGGTYTSPAGVIIAKAQQIGPNLFLQNSSPIAFGTPFTEPTGGLVNNLNPTRTKLQWFRRAGYQDGNGTSIDAWFTVVPTGGLSSYNETISLAFGSSVAAGNVSIWRGCAANPFDPNFLIPVLETNASIAVNTAVGNIVVLGHFNTGYGGSGVTAGSGFIQLSQQSYMNAEYAPFTTAQTGLNITQTGGQSYNAGIADVLVGASASPTLVSNQAITSASGATVSFTIASANAGDVIYLGFSAHAAAIGKVGAPAASSAVGVSPVILIQNCLAANYNPSSTGGWGYVADNGNAAIPGANLTVTSSLQANPYNGSTFTAPLWATVFTDPNQADFNYALNKPSSPAVGTATVPSPSTVHGQSLIPIYEVSWSGLPTPGTPIPAKAGRSDINAPGGSIGALF